MSNYKRRSIDYMKAVHHNLHTTRRCINYDCIINTTVNYIDNRIIERYGYNTYINICFYDMDYCRVDMPMKFWSRARTRHDIIPSKTITKRRTIDTKDQSHIIRRIDNDGYEMTDNY